MNLSPRAGREPRSAIATRAESDHARSFAAWQDHEVPRQAYEHPFPQS
jgi:hypothetical protein